MGLKLDFVKGEGPAIENPLTRPYDIDLLATPPAEESMSGTLHAIGLVSKELAPRNIPLIGFAGAPFTLASYAIEGGGSSHYAKTKALMYSEPAAWKRLMTKLVTVQADYLVKQAKAGAAALQIFDSWAGQALGHADYLRYVQPYNQQLFQLVASAGVPVINFSLGVASYFLDVVACGGDVIGLDWRMPLDWYWRQLDFAKPVQGNLDPIALLAPWRELEPRIDAVLAQAAGRPGHIFNLGHGILPNTPIAHVQRLVDHVREKTTNVMRIA
jgi:uroporphyrinogen decarboxylase